MVCFTNCQNDVLAFTQYTPNTMKHGFLAIIAAAIVGGVALLLLVTSSSRSSNDAYDKNWSSPHRRLGAQNLFFESSSNTNNEEVKYLVTFEDRLESPGVRCAVLAKAKGGKVSRIHKEVNACSIIMPRDAQQTTPGELSVKIFEEDGEAHAYDDDNDFTKESNLSSPIFARERQTQQESVSTSLWGLDRINQCSATRDGLATPQDATGVHVFIIDTGIRGTHEQFKDTMGISMMGPTDCHFSAYSTNRADALTDGNGHG
jgi:subtilisin family serine protease